MNEVAMLKWAAGADEPIARGVEYDEERLVEALSRHKLTGRFLRRADREQPRWVRPSSLERLTEQQAQVERAFSERLAALEQVFEAFAGDPAPPVVVKGLTAYALTADPIFIRASRDIDLVHEDGGRLVSRLEQLGFRLNDDHCRGHEVAALDRGPVKADLHAYFPVVSGPDVAPPPRNGRVWQGLDRLSERRVDHRTLLAHSIGAERIGRAALRVPNATLATFLLALHTFREFAHEPFPVPYATVRLGDLVEIRELAAHPSFDDALFERLVVEHAAETSIAFVDYVLSSYLGTRLPSAAPAGTPLFPHDLWIDGFAIVDRSAAEPDPLLIREDSAPLPRLVTRLGGGTVLAESNGDRRKYSTRAGMSAELPPRLLEQRDGLAASFAFRWRDVGLGVEVELPQLDRGVVRVLVNAGDVLHEIEYDAGDHSAVPSWQRNTGLGRRWRAPVAIECERADCALRLGFELPWDRALPGCARDRSLPLLFGIRRLAPDRDEADGAGVLVPLELRPA